MSGSDRPSRRRRIAGEGHPGAPAAAVPPRRVIRKPVARPGSRPETTEPEGGGTEPAGSGADSTEETRDPSPGASRAKAKARSKAAKARGSEATTGADTARTSAPLDEPEDRELDDPERDDPERDDPERDDPERDDAELEKTAVSPAARIKPAGRRPGRRRSAPVADDPEASEDEAAVPIPPVVLPEDEGVPGAGGVAGGRAARLGRTPLLAALLAALIFGGVFGYLGWDKVFGPGPASSHAEAASAAEVAAETILGYRYDQLDDHLERSQALMTPTFGREFETISPALDDLAPQRQIVVEALARDAAPEPCGTDCSSSQVDVLVFVDQARLADGEERPTVFGNRITMTMVERDGEWLVDDIEAL